MPDSSRSRRLLRFDIFEADVSAGELRKNGVKVRLQEQPFQVLALLLENAGAIITREELRQRLWPADTFVDFDNALNRSINKIREALGDSAEEPRFIETLARRGYRFIGSPAVAPVQTAARIGSLVVLPLENLSRDPEQEYFADGLTEALITQLAKIRALRVVSRTTAMQYKGAHRRLPDIARELNVDAVVEGAVLRCGERVRITAQLIDAPNEAHIWAESYERDMRDIINLQAEVAAAIAREIQVKLTPQERMQLARSRQVDPEAYDFYLKGRYHASKRGREGLTRGAEFLQKAIDQDPSYAAAYASLADTLARLGFWCYVSPESGCARALSVARKALELDDTNAEAHAALAFAALHYDQPWERVKQACDRAIELDPLTATAFQTRALYHLTTAHFDEALSAVLHSLELDPFAMGVQFQVAATYYYMGQYDQGIATGRKILDFEPRFHPAQWTTSLCLAKKGDYIPAIAAMEHVVRLTDAEPYYLGALGICYGAAGKRAQALATVERFHELSKQRYMPVYYVADIYAAMNENDEAFRYLEMAYREHAALMVYTRAFPGLDPIRSDPRYFDLLRRMKYPD